jgi:alkylation response protein AidB-like acyl-CoA dehydrogenase
MDFGLTEEQKMLKDMVARFVEKEITPRAAEWDEEEAFPSEVFRAMADLGLFGISIPEAYGGSEFGAGTSQIQRMIILRNLLNGADPFLLQPECRERVYRRRSARPTRPTPRSKPLAGSGMS